MLTMITLITLIIIIITIIAMITTIARIVAGLATVGAGGVVGVVGVVGSVGVSGVVGVSGAVGPDSPQDRLIPQTTNAGCLSTRWSPLRGACPPGRAPGRCELVEGLQGFVTDPGQPGGGFGAILALAAGRLS